MIEVLAETGSTNEELAARLRAGARVAEGHWIVADRQVAGKGRLGRTWEDGAGNFMGSTVVHLGHGDPSPATLSLVAGLAVFSVLAPLLPVAAKPSLKWPNDLMTGRGKLAGILLEREGDAVIVGIGANLRSAPEIKERPAAAVSEFAEPPSRDEFAQLLATAFDRELQRWRTSGTAPVARRWATAAHAPGTPLQVHEPDGSTCSGTFAGLSEAGGLQLRLADGSMRVIHAGDVILNGQGG